MKILLKTYFSFVLAIALMTVLQTCTLRAREILISNPTELTELASALPGDAVVLKNGVWNDVHINVTKGGSADAPLVIRAETAGEVILEGNSNLKIDAPYVTVDGLYFRRGAKIGGNVITFNSSHGIVRNCTVMDAHPLNLETKGYFVFFSGENNRVDRCYFKGKSNDNPVIGNDRGVCRYNAVTASYFKDIPYDPKNGREIFRIWGYGGFCELGTDGAFFTIEGNLFDHADGEGEEIISLKSNRNRVVGNTILATRGGINIRAGSFNTIQGNIILGKGVEGSAGIRMSGESNVVRDNFISGCDDGIQLACGDYIKKALTEKFVPTLRGTPPIQIPFYGQVKNLTLSGNVLVGIKNADLKFGARYKFQWPKLQAILVPEDNLIENNRIVRPHGGAAVVGVLPGTDKDPVIPKLTFLPNKYAGNIIVGGTNDFVPSKDGFKVEKMPVGWSEVRESAKFPPLTAADVGPDWVRSKGL